MHVFFIDKWENVCKAVGTMAIMGQLGNGTGIVLCFVQDAVA